MAEQKSEIEHYSEIIFHFDTEKHSVPLKLFIDVANSSKKVLDDFNKTLFEKNLKYELRVEVPEKGGFIETISLAVIAGGGAIWAFLGTDIGKAFILGLTQKEPEYWSKRFGEYLGEKISSSNQKDDQPEQSVLEILSGDETLHTDELNADLLAEIVKLFLKSDLETLQRTGIKPELLRQAFIARNRLYSSCLEAQEVRGLGFDRSHEFKLSRAEFPRYLAEIPQNEPTEKDEEKSWVVKTTDIVVNSPNWKRDGRRWQADIQGQTDISFTVEDENFWHHVQLKDIQPDIRDNMRVQWAYNSHLNNPRDARVLRVLSYNGKKISEPISQHELNRVLSHATILEPESPDLFDQFENETNKEIHIRKKT